MDPDATSADPPATIGERYLQAHRSFVDLARALTIEDWSTPVPCCPGWTCRDVLSHVAGIPDDAFAGRMDGVATPPWTEAQVARWRDTPVEDLLAQWEAQAPMFASVLDQLGESRPPIDCQTHEFDVRQALGRPGNRDSAIVRMVAAEFRATGPIAVPEGVDDFELFRSRIGRRSGAQVLAYAWPSPPDEAALAEWFVFGPSEVDIHE
jgi:uncharacterized protein (TIGR03083 family)